MNRRTFIFSSVAVVGLSAVLVHHKAGAYQANLTQLMQRLEAFKGQSLRSDTPWTASQVFQHLAQSVEGSLHGFAQLKPAWFRASIGPMALAVFQARGKMSHPLDEPIPGAASLDPTVAADAALDRLLASLTALQQASITHPHFAYGDLTVAQAMAAHQLHIEQHLTALHLA